MSSSQPSPDSPSEPMGRLLAANELAEAGRFAEAEQAYGQLLKAEPTNVEAHFNRGEVLGQLDRLEEAVDAWQQSIRHQPDIAEAHRTLAETLRTYWIDRYEAGMPLPGMEPLEEALLHYREAHIAIAGLRHTYSKIGNALMELGRLFEADEALKQAEFYSEGLEHAYRDLSMALSHPGDLATVAAIFRRRLALAPDHDPFTEGDYFSTDLEFTDDAILMPDGFEVMMEWERPIMERAAEIICATGGDVLNVGFGMAIIDTAIQSHPITSHSIIEAHPQVIKRAQAWAEDKHNVTIFEGTWQSVIDTLPRFDGIYFDTLLPPMIPFLEKVPQLLKPGGVFSHFQFMIQLENMETMCGQGFEFGMEQLPFEHLPENHYYRLTEQDNAGRFHAPMFVYRRPGEGA